MELVITILVQQDEHSRGLLYTVVHIVTYTLRFCYELISCGVLRKQNPK